MKKDTSKDLSLNPDVIKPLFMVTEFDVNTQLAVLSILIKLEHEAYVKSGIVNYDGN